MKLSITERSLEDYLSTIFRLEAVFGIASTGEIARELNVSYGTVTNMLKKLERRGLIKRERYRGVKLTKEGTEIAKDTVKVHRIVERFLTDIVGVDMNYSHKLAHKVEHDFKEVYERLDAILGYPDKCPHGNPIPRGKEIKENEVKLSEASKDKTYILSRIPIENENLLNFLVAHNMLIGKRIHIISLEKQYLKLEVDNRIVEIPRSFGEIIYLKEVR